MKKLILLSAIILAVCTTTAQIINIPADYPSIQQGINAATDDEIVLVQSGTYLENIDYHGKNIIVASLFFTTQDTAYISQTIIDGSQGGTVVTFDSGESQDAILSGFTITNGHSSTSGGGISCIYGSTPHLDNLCITGNSAQYNGGGIICGGSASPSLKDVVIKSNSAGGDGGGIYCYNNCSPSLENVTISDNSSSYHGGGICCLQYCSPNLNAVTISSNSANDGGGIFCAGKSNLNLLSVTIDSNSAIRGGGIFMNECSPIFSELIITNNTANIGGGIFCDEHSDLNLSQSTISNNEATIRGGGISANASNLIISGTNFKNNLGESQGGALNYYNTPNTPGTFDVDIFNCLFEDNVSYGASACVGIGKAQEDASIINIEIDSCSFLGNTADSRTALFVMSEDITLNISNSIFKYNTATKFAAGISISGFTQGKVTNCLFANNDAAKDGGNYNSGGASVWSEASVDFINCTFADNTADYGSALTVGGGGIAKTINCVFWGNSKGQIALDTYNDLGGIITIDNSIVQYGTDSIQISSLSTLNWGEGNMDQDPVFIGSGNHPYQINDYSPCIDAGTPDTTALNLPEFDLAGEIRIFNDRVDMGAYEWNTFVGVNEFDPESFRGSSKLKVQSFPNPFTTSTTIAYELQQPSTIQITIYNHLGKQVEVMEKNQSAGKQQLVWNGEGMPVGVYFCVLKTESGIQTLKMIKMK